MRRQVAIQGPTPGFVRWAIWHPCPLRPLEESRFIDRSFRWLRGLREYSIARSQQRCGQDLCFDHQADREQVAETWGFSIAEVTAPWGGLPNVEQACRSCRANVAAAGESEPLAGCFGFLPEAPFDLDALIAGQVASEMEESSFGLVQAVNAIAQSESFRDHVRQAFGDFVQPWYGFWKPHRLDPQQCQVLEGVLGELTRFGGSLPDVWLNAVDRLRRAAQVCQGTPTLCVERIPSGFASGETWQLAPACGNCGCDRDQNMPHGPCPACQTAGPWPTSATVQGTWEAPLLTTDRRLRS